MHNLCSCFRIQYSQIAHCDLVIILPIVFRNECLQMSDLGVFVEHKNRKWYFFIHPALWSFSRGIHLSFCRDWRFIQLSASVLCLLGNLSLRAICALWRYSQPQTDVRLATCNPLVHNTISCILVAAHHFDRQSWEPLTWSIKGFSLELK